MITSDLDLPVARFLLNGMLRLLCSLALAALLAGCQNPWKDFYQGAQLPADAPDNGLPEDIREHMRLMCDIVALGFQTDKTRLATLLLCRDISGLFYPFLDAKLAHHLASHEEDDAFMRINKYQSMPEGEGTVLDNSCLVFMSNMWSGKNHDSNKVPLLTAGGLGGTLETGRVLDFTEAGNDNRKLCSLYLSLMDRMGVKLDQFGDAQTRLAGI